MINIHKKPALLSGLGVMLTLFTIYGVIIIITNGFSVRIGEVELSSISYLKSYLLSILPVFSGYYYTKRGFVNVELLKKWIPFFLIIGGLVFYREETERMALLLEDGMNEESFTNNAGYFILGILPCSLIYYKKPVYQYLVVLFCAFFILMSMKRGAIIIASLVICYMVFTEYVRGSAKIKTTVIIGGAFAICFGLYYINHYLIQNDFFMGRIADTLEGKTSGRDVLYSSLVDHIIHKMTLFSFIMGEGGMATVRIIGKYAHNDWLEIFICHGVMGVSLFIYYWSTFMRSCRNKQLHITSRMMLISYLIMYFIMTFFSMSIGGMTVFAGLMIGFALADGFMIQK